MNLNYVNSSQFILPDIEVMPDLPLILQVHDVQMKTNHIPALSIEDPEFDPTTRFHIIIVVTGSFGNPETTPDTREEEDNTLIKPNFALLRRLHSKEEGVILLIT